MRRVNKGGLLSASSLLASPPHAEYMPASPPPGSVARTEDLRSRDHCWWAVGWGVFEKLLPPLPWKEAPGRGVWLVSQPSGRIW